MDSILKHFSCQILGHNQSKIIGVCEDLNCAQPYRRVCFECLKTHIEQDPQFDIQNIKDEQQIQTIIQQFIEKQKDVLNQIVLSCQIQTHILRLEMIEFLKSWKFKLMYQKDIFQKLSAFFQQVLKKISVEDYLLGDSNIQGVFKYLNKIEDQIKNLDNYHKNYLINIVNIKQQDYSTNIQMNSEVIKQEKLFQDILQNLSKHQEKQLDKIVQNIYIQQPQHKDNPQVEFWEFILKQGFELKTKNLYQQFQNLKYLDQLERYEDLYLQAYSLYYSEAQDIQLSEQLNLINKSIQFNNSYTKSQELKKIEKANEFIEKGFNYYKNNQYLEAINLLDQAIKLNPRQQKAYFIKGISFQKLMRHEEAMNIFELALRLKPNEIHILKKKVISLQYLKKYEEALELIDYVVQQDPTNCFLFIIKGAVLYKLNRYEEAQLYFLIPQCHNLIIIKVFYLII